MRSSVHRGPKRRSAALLGVNAGLCILAAAALLGACGQQENAPPGPSASPSPSASYATSLTAVERNWLTEHGALEVGAFNDYPPFGFVDANGQAVGLAVDYWNLVAERLGVQVTFTPVLFAEQLEGLKQGRFDTLQGIFPLAERKQWFAFSRAYFAIDTRIYTDASHANLTSLKALRGAEGVSVAVVDGDSGQEIADKAGLITLVVAGYPQAVMAVASGSAQAMVLDEMVADYYIEQFKVGAQVKPVGKAVASGLMTMPVRKGDTVLLGILNKGIELVGEHEFEGIYESWMGQ